MKIRKLIFCMMAMGAMMSFPVLASESEQEEQCILLPVGTTSSKDTVNAVERSSIISSASSEIIDETGGDIGVIIETNCHIECEEIRNIAILDRLNEETGQWVEQSRYDFTAVKEDFPNTALTSLTNAFTIRDQDTGYYYRIRGIHSVSTPDDGGQIYSTRTNGLLITEYGR